MRKSELKEILIDAYGCDEEELKSLTKDELQELYMEYSDDSDMFPNGRDYDAEDWED